VNDPIKGFTFRVSTCPSNTMQTLTDRGDPIFSVMPKFNGVNPFSHRRDRALGSNGKCDEYFLLHFRKRGGHKKTWVFDPSNLARIELLANIVIAGKKANLLFRSIARSRA
jgi:hypothetical protein